jgi:hypothetical protein
MRKVASKGAEFWRQVEEAKRMVARAEAQGDILRDQFEQRPDEDAQPTWTVQTNTSDPSRPRTRSASYWAEQQVLQITFRNGQKYNYYEVTKQQAASLKRVASTGKLINSRLNAHPYGEVS